MNFWILGFLWGSARLSGKYLLVQSRRHEWVQKIRDEILPDRKIYSVTVHDGTSWCLKIPAHHEYVSWMVQNGYEGRKGNEERNMPVFSDPEDEAEFFRGYFAPHHTLDTWNNRGVKRPRLRFFASQPILERLNHHLHVQIGAGVKKIQGHSGSSVCKTLYYQSGDEIRRICEYLQIENPADD